MKRMHQYRRVGMGIPASTERRSLRECQDRHSGGQHRERPRISHVRGPLLPRQLPLHLTKRPDWAAGLRVEVRVFAETTALLHLTAEEPGWRLDTKKPPNVVTQGVGGLLRNGRLTPGELHPHPWGERALRAEAAGGGKADARRDRPGVAGVIRGGRNRRHPQ
jgi:hypothetical protein